MWTTLRYEYTQHCLDSGIKWEITLYPYHLQFLISRSQSRQVQPLPLSQPDRDSNEVPQNQTPSNFMSCAVWVRAKHSTPKK